MNEKEAKIQSFNDKFVSSSFAAKAFEVKALFSLGTLRVVQRPRHCKQDWDIKDAVTTCAITGRASPRRHFFQINFQTLSRWVNTIRQSIMAWASKK